MENRMVKVHVCQNVIKNLKCMYMYVHVHWKQYVTCTCTCVHACVTWTHLHVQYMTLQPVI